MELEAEQLNEMEYQRSRIIHLSSFQEDDLELMSKRRKTFQAFDSVSLLFRISKVENDDSFINNVLSMDWVERIIIFLTLEDIRDCFVAFNKAQRNSFILHLQKFVVIVITKNEKLQQFLLFHSISSRDSIINSCDTIRDATRRSHYILVPKTLWTIYSENGYLKYFYYTWDLSDSRVTRNVNLPGHMDHIGWGEYGSWKSSKDSSVSLKNFIQKFNRKYVEIRFGTSNPTYNDRNCWWRCIAHHIFCDENRYRDIKDINILFLTLSESQFLTLFGVNKLSERQQLIQFLNGYGWLEQTLESLRQDNELMDNVWVELLMYTIIWPTFTFCVLYTDTDIRKSLKCAIGEKSNGYNVGLHFDNSSESSTLDIIYTLFTRIYKGTEICQQQLDHWNHFNVNDCSHVSFIILHEQHFFPLSHRIN